MEITVNEVTAEVEAEKIKAVYLPDSSSPTKSVYLVEWIGPGLTVVMSYEAQHSTETLHLAVAEGSGAMMAQVGEATVAAHMIAAKAEMGSGRFSIANLGQLLYNTITRLQANGYENTEIGKGIVVGIKSVMDHLDARPAPQVEPQAVVEEVADNESSQDWDELMETAEE